MPQTVQTINIPINIKLCPAIISLDQNKPANIKHPALSS